jgi:hypothetical protein
MITHPLEEKQFSDLPLREKLKNNLFKDGLIKTMVSSVNDPSLKESFRNELNHLLDNRIDIFDNELLIGYLYEDEDKIEDLILPSIRRAWASVFIKPPSLFSFQSDDQYNRRRGELFQLLWSVDDFIDYLLEILPKVKDTLKEFEFLDKTAQTLELIAQNYINSLIDKCKAKRGEELLIEIRDLKIKKTLC